MQRIDRFAYQILRNLELIPDWRRHLGNHWLVACSGGADSVALAEVLFQISEREKINLSVAHVHHGLADSEEQSLARDQMRKVVESFALHRKIPFFTATHEGLRPLKSEADFRAFRIESLREMAREAQATSVWLGQHRLDQLETRLIRLIRGCGQKGIIGMKTISRLNQMLVVRPFLDVDRDDILNFAMRRKLEFIEDPSNSNTIYLRNWLRQFWLPELEKRHPGALRSMGRSLEILAQGDEQDGLLETQSADGGQEENLASQSAPDSLSFCRKTFAGLSAKQQLSFLPTQLQKLGANFSRNQLLEVIKRLDSPRQRLRFTVNGVVWNADREAIEAYLVSTRQ